MVWAFASSAFFTSSTTTPFKFVMDVEDLSFAITSGGRGSILQLFRDIAGGLDEIVHGVLEVMALT
jgi:hypothetical protein